MAVFNKKLLVLIGALVLSACGSSAGPDPTSVTPIGGGAIGGAGGGGGGCGAGSSTTAVCVVASPASVLANGTSVITATVATSGVAVAPGTAVNFTVSNPLLGSVSPTSTTTTVGGTASVTFTALTVPGTVTVTATSSGATGTVPITI